VFGCLRSCYSALFKMRPNFVLPENTPCYWYFVDRDAPRFMDRHTFAPYFYTKDIDLSEGFNGDLGFSFWYSGDAFGAMKGAGILGEARNYLINEAPPNDFMSSTSGGWLGSPGPVVLGNLNVFHPIYLSTHTLLIEGDFGALQFNVIDTVHVRWKTEVDDLGYWFEIRRILHTQEHKGTYQLYAHKAATEWLLSIILVFPDPPFSAQWQDLSGSLPVAYQMGYLVSLLP